MDGGASESTVLLRGGEETDTEPAVAAAASAQNEWSALLAAAPPATAVASKPWGAAGARLDFLDQYRGFVMASMILVNFLGDGGFAATPPLFRHGKFYVSYSDTVMPGFLFAAGLSFRLTHMRNIQKMGPWRARFKVLVPRALGLFIVSYWLYGFGGSEAARLSWAELVATPALEKALSFFFGSYFGALTQIALTMLWCLPVIEHRVWVRVAYAILCQWLYLGIFAGILLTADDASYLPGDEGGPFAFLSWTFPLLAGSICYDWLHWISAQTDAASPPLAHPASAVAYVTVAGPGPEASDAASPNGPARRSAATPTTATWLLETLLGASLASVPVRWRAMNRAARRGLALIVAGAFALMVAGYLLSMLALVLPVQCLDSLTLQEADCSLVAFPLPPFIVPTDPNAAIVCVWTMVECFPTFMIFTTGFAVLVCVASFWICDVMRWRLWALHDVYDAFGKNTLLAYYFHFGAREAIAAWMPVDAPGGIVFLGLVICLGSLYLGMAHLRHHKMFVSV